MNNEIKIFSSPEFGEIRTAGTSEQPLFCLADVCKALSINNNRQIKARLNPKGVITTDTPTEGGIQQMNFIDEPNLYKCIFQSRKKEAEVFQDWVTSEVLPSIRKEGGYMTAKDNESEEDLLARALVVAQSAIQRKEERIKALQKENELQSKQIVFIQAENETLKAKQNYLDVVLQCRSTVTTTAIAQDYGMSAKAFNSTLHSMGIQHRVGGQWILYRKYLPLGYVQSDTVSIVRSNGQPDVVLSTKWTQKGRLFLYNTLKTNGVLPLIER